MVFFLKNNYIIFIHSVNSPNLWPESWPVLYVHKYIGIIEKTKRDQINTVDCEVFYSGFKQCLSPESLLISRWFCSISSPAFCVLPFMERHGSLEATIFLCFLTSWQLIFFFTFFYFETRQIEERYTREAVMEKKRIHWEVLLLHQRWWGRWCRRWRFQCRQESVKKTKKVVSFEILIFYDFFFLVGK
jgi:hypothetical protein